MDRIWKDTVIRGFFLNILLVIFSYAFGVMTGMASNAIMTPFRTLILFIYLYITFSKLTLSNFKLLKNEWHTLVLFIGMIFFLLFFSLDFFRTIDRTSQFAVPFIYILLVTMYLRKQYAAKEAWFYYLLIINMTYAVPILSYLLMGGGLEAKNIYGMKEEGAFASNHYGWASLFFILTFYDLYVNFTLEKWYKWFGFLMITPALLLMLISGNRASYICFIVAGLIFFFRHNSVNLLIRLVLVAFFSFYVYDQLSDEQTALSARFKKTELQLEDEEQYGDTRKTARDTGFEVMNKHPETYLTGFGLFSFKEAIESLEPNTSESRIRSGVHNSYLELFFGSGIIVFGFFMIIYILYPLRIYMLYYSDKFLFVLPVFIIPFFESNLTGGQFLFYPWLTTAVLLRLYKHIPKEDY
jgi:hypothetical protein